MIPTALPSAHSVFAAAVWSPGFGLASRPPSPVAPALTTADAVGLLDGVPEIANQPETPSYGPWRDITVRGSNASQAEASPP